MAKKHKHEEHENHERWLVSYADFITLLFAFFVVMYSVSRVDKKKVSRAADSIRWAMHFSGTGGLRELPIFEGPPSNGGCAANLGQGDRRGPEALKAVEEVQKRLNRRLRPFLLEKRVQQAVQIEVARNRLVVRLAATHFFNSAQAALRPEALPVLDALGDELKALGRDVRIEAHTDDAPLGGGRFRNNWELSAARAATVAALFEQGHGYRPDLLTAAGLASARPLFPNDTEAHREANRRVELVLDLGGATGAAPVTHPPAEPASIP